MNHRGPSVPLRKPGAVGPCDRCGHLGELCDCTVCDDCGDDPCTCRRAVVARPDGYPPLAPVTCCNRMPWDCECPDDEEGCL